MADNTRYRVVDFLGGRILESREMMTLQSIAEGLDPSGNIVVQDLNALYREGATLNVQAVITTGTTTVTLAPINTALPMQVFVHGRWEILRTGDAPAVTLTSGQTNLYLNWALNIITSVQDATLVDPTTGEPTANMGELDFSMSATDTSATALTSGQLAKNTAPVILFSFTPSGATLLPAPIDNVNAPALANATSSGLVKLSTGTSSGVAASTDDSRLSDARNPLAGSVVDASVRTPVAVSGVTNADGSAQYDLTTDPGGISADKIILQSAKERISDVISWVKAQITSVLSTLSSHIGVALGNTSTHPMPTYSQVGAAPLSHVTLPLGVTGSHPPEVNQNSGGFEVNQTAVSGTPNDPAYGVFTSGMLLAALTHQGDLYSTLLSALVASPGGTPLNFTGPLTGLASTAQVLVDHVNQTTGATNPHGITLQSLGGTALSVSSITTVTGGSTSFTVAGSTKTETTAMNWVILRFAPNATTTGNAIEVALGSGTVLHGAYVPLPNANFGYTSFLAHAGLGVNWGWNETINDLVVTVGVGTDGVTPTPGMVYCQTWNNSGGGPTGTPLANVFAVAWRTGA